MAKTIRVEAKNYRWALNYHANHPEEEWPDQFMLERTIQNVLNRATKMEFHVFGDTQQDGTILFNCCLFPRDMVPHVTYNPVRSFSIDCYEKMVRCEEFEFEMPFWPSEVKLG